MGSVAEGRKQKVAGGARPLESRRAGVGWFLAPHSSLLMISRPFDKRKVNESPREATMLMKKHQVRQEWDKRNEGGVKNQVSEKKEVSQMRVGRGAEEKMLKMQSPPTICMKTHLKVTRCHASNSRFIRGKCTNHAITRGELGPLQGVEEHSHASNLGLAKDLTLSVFHGREDSSSVARHQGRRTFRRGPATTRQAPGPLTGARDPRWCSGSHLEVARGSHL